MFRRISAFVILSLLVQIAGLGTLIELGEEQCEQSEPGDCSSECEDCVCCPHQRVVTLQPNAPVFAPEVQTLDFPAMAAPVEDPRTHEIFHIPKQVFSA